MLPLIFIILLLVVLKIMESEPVLGVFVAVMGWLILVEVYKSKKHSWSNTLADLGVLAIVICSGIAIFQLIFSVF